MGRLVRYRATVSFDQIRAGGIYDLDLDVDPEWGAYIANGWFVEAPEFGEPDQPVEVSASGQDIAPARDPALTSDEPAPEPRPVAVTDEVAATTPDGVTPVAARNRRKTTTTRA